MPLSAHLLIRGGCRSALAGSVRRRRRCLQAGGSGPWHSPRSWAWFQSETKSSTHAKGGCVCARSPPKETCDIMLTRQVDQLHELTLQLVELERVQLDIAVHREAQADRFGTAVCHLHRKATSSSSMPNQRT